MNTIIEQIPAPELVAEIADSRAFAGAIADGSQAIAHDGFDVETFEQAVDDYARLGRTVNETSGVIRTGSALLRDLFWSFHKRSPRVAPVTPLSPAHEINREIVEQILSTTEWREMRESGTVGDPLSSAMATIGCAASAVAALDKETIRYLNQLHELTGEVEQLFARAEALDELAALSIDKDRSEWGQATPAEVIACASFFFNGGTVFEPWMKKALELVDESRFEKADVICVSDGISDISPEAQTEWTKRRAARGMRAYGALIGANQGEALLAAISDAVFRLDDLRGDLPALEVIFSAV